MKSPNRMFSAIYKETNPAEKSPVPASSTVTDSFQGQLLQRFKRNPYTGFKFNCSRFPTMRRIRINLVLLMCMAFILLDVSEACPQNETFGYFQCQMRSPPENKTLITLQIKDEYKMFFRNHTEQAEFLRKYALINKRPGSVATSKQLKRPRRSEECLKNCDVSDGAETINSPLDTKRIEAVSSFPGPDDDSLPINPTLHHSCCKSNVTFEPLYSAPTIDKEPVTIIQCLTLQQHFMVETCSMDTCTQDCECEVQDTLVMAMVLTQQNSVTFANIKIPGCCKCVNSKGDE